MPWEERDWAKWTDEERDRYLGTSGSGSGSSERPLVGGSRLNRRLSRGQTILAFALIAAFLGFTVHKGLKQYPWSSNGQAQPLVLPSANPTRILRGQAPAGKHTPQVPRSAPTTERVPMSDMPSTLRRGTYVTTRGTLGSDVSGVVIVEGRWGTGPWYRLATAPVKNGIYRVRYLLDRAGLVHLRIALPDGSFLVATTRIR